MLLNEEDGGLTDGLTRGVLFDLSYDLGNATSYILRCKRKHDDEGVECITKAIEHLKYELKKIKKNKGRGCCNLK